MGQKRERERERNRKKGYERHGTVMAKKDEIGITLTESITNRANTSRQTGETERETR